MSWNTVVLLLAVCCFTKSAFSRGIHSGISGEHSVLALTSLEGAGSLEHDDIEKRSSEEDQTDAAKYGVNTIALNPGQQGKILDGIKAFGIRQPIYVVNIGKGSAEIGRIYKPASANKEDVWKLIDDKRIIHSGQKHTFNFDQMFVRSAMEVKNPSDTRVILYAARVGEKSGYNTIEQKYKEPLFNFDNIALKASKFVLTTGTKYVPAVGPALSGLISALWPEKSQKIIDPWAERLKNVKNLISQAKFDSVNFILTGKLEDYRSSTQDLMSKVYRSDVSNAYMRHIYQLRTVPNYFSCIDKSKDGEICYSVLPLFTQLINTNLAFYNWGIQYAKNISLSELNLLDVTTYRNDMLRTAIDYINELYETKIEETYNTCHPDEFYNSMMDVRRYMALYGIEYITHWKNILDSESKIDYNLITYSAFHGMSSANLYKQAMLEFGTEPLTPKLITSASGEQRRNKLVEVQASYGTSNYTIYGITLTFEEGEPIELGTKMNLKSPSLQMKDRVIEHLDVDFDSHIDCLRFHMSDGENIVFGTCSGKGSKRFQLSGHHIASLFVANDIPSMQGALANIAVSYQQKPIDEPTVNV